MTTPNSMTWVYNNINVTGQYDDKWSICDSKGINVISLKDDDHLAQWLSSIIQAQL